MTGLVMGGACCVAIGVLVGSSLRGPEEPLYHEGNGAPAQVATVLPSFRELVDRTGDAIVSVRAFLPGAVDHAVADGGTGEARTGVGPEDVAALVHDGLPLRRNGSGFVVQERGLVLTSRHVVRGAVSIEVHLPHYGRRFADVIGEDPATDLALLRMVAPPPGLQPLELGSSDDLHAGDWIVAVGSPFGFSRTVTAGLVSFVGRHLHQDALGVSHDFLQISAPINPGNSGGPVLDVNGRVVGLITQVAAAAQGISFAVPSRSVKWALDAMQRQPDGLVRRGYLGIAFAPRPGLDDDGRPLPGAVIVEVVAGQAADLAGLQAGDVVLRVDGAPIHAPKDLHERIVQSAPGATMALELLRDDRPSDPIIARLGEVGGRDGDAPN